jgi:hypothetical protein
MLDFLLQSENPPLGDPIQTGLAYLVNAKLMIL